MAAHAAAQRTRVNMASFIVAQGCYMLTKCKWIQIYKQMKAGQILLAVAHVI